MSPYQDVIRNLRIRASGLTVEEFEKQEVFDLLKKDFTPNYSAILQQIRSAQK